MQDIPILNKYNPSEHSLASQDLFKHNSYAFIEKLENSSIKSVLHNWLKNLSPETRRNYSYYVTDMIRRNIIPEKDALGNPFTVGHFRLIPHELVLDYIKSIKEWSEGTRQLHAAVYISLTSYLSRISQGWVRKVEPSRLRSNPTFYKVREKCATNALTLAEWYKFISELSDINTRDSLIARSAFHGAKRITEVISIKLSQIDWGKNIIRYRQSKSCGTFREIPITFPLSFMEELKMYITETIDIRKDSPFVFITRTGKMVTRFQLNKIKVTPHVLRATWVTLVRNQGASDSQIMQVTGHRNNTMVMAYDKTSDEENISKKINFI